MEDIKGVFIESDSSILEKYKNLLSKSFSLTTFGDTNSSLAHIVENNLSINFYIVRLTDKNEDAINFFMEKIKSVNPQIKPIIIEFDKNMDKGKYENALIFTKGEDVNNVASVIKRNMEESNESQRRRYSRVNWPLNVIIAFKDKSRNSIDRNILSISGNGAYVCSETSIPEKGDMLGLTISFKDFKLFTEAKVVWINANDEKPNFPKGFAVQFIDIGPASQKIIDQIIRDKLLQEILIEYKDENFSS